MMQLFLTPEQIEEMTGRKQIKAQCRWMDENGIRWKLNAAGKLLVSPRHVEQVLCGETTPARERTGPNLKALAR